MNLEIASKHESEGDFDSALIAYRSIDTKPLSDSEKIYIKRSIAACLFYLKKYEEAETIFIELLSIKELDGKELDEIKDCLNICFLYGDKPKLAFTHFTKKINSKEISELEMMWSYWYIGQYHQMVENYAECLSAYKKSYEISHLLDLENKAFFFSHYLIACIYLQEVEKASSEVEKYELNNNVCVSFGLLNIAKGIIYKILKIENWKEIYNEGIKEAIESRYQENIDIGLKLNKEFG